MVADEQSPEALPRTGRLGVTANHQLRALAAFHLQPIIAAPWLVRPVAALRDDALQVHLARLLEKYRSISRDVLRKVKGRRKVCLPQQVREQVLSLFQR